MKKRVFVDMDAYIEDREHRTIAEIFASDGEEHFRALERETVSALADSGFVVATGGGAMVRFMSGKKMPLITAMEKAFERDKSL